MKRSNISFAGHLPLDCMDCVAVPCERGCQRWDVPIKADVPKAVEGVESGGVVQPDIDGTTYDTLLYGNKVSTGFVSMRLLSALTV